MRRREFLILAGKFQLVDPLWGKQVPHYKHRRRSTTYFLREIPVKNRERWGRSQQTGKLSGKFCCLIIASSSAIRRPNATWYSVSLSLALSLFFFFFFFSRSLSLSLSLSHYKHKRRSTTYLLREIPVKNRERWDRSQQTVKLSG